MRGRRWAAGMIAVLSGAMAMAVEPDAAIRNSAGMELKLIPAGTFAMGDPQGDRDETPHKVTLTTAFYIGVHEVTNAQWKRVMENVPSHWREDSLPVERVGWEDAVEFCRRLSELPEERAAARVYRLPTEAEWEHACRGGTTTRFGFGDDESLLAAHGWFADNSVAQTHAVGQKKPNAWGLHDMHGNVWEWCSDRYGYYPKEDVIDPPGVSAGTARVVRGGGWYLGAGQCRAAFRGRCHPARRDDYLGLRVALDVPQLPDPVPAPDTDPAAAKTRGEGEKPPAG